MNEGVYYKVEELLNQMSDIADRISLLCNSIVGGGGSNLEQDWGLNLDEGWLDISNGFTGV